MSCGCGAKPGESGRKRTCIVMCYACIHRTEESCSILDRPCREIVELRIPCPESRHPDASGVLISAGLRHYGVPAVIRWLWPILRRIHGWKAMSGPLPGCGCLKFWKDKWDVARRPRV